MKRLNVTLSILLLGFVGSATAGDCEIAGYSPLATTGAIDTALSGRQITAVAPGGEEWNEDHCATGALYKLGDGSTVDPRAFRGTWTSVAGSPAGVQYNYTVGGSSTFTWTLWENGGGGLCWEDSFSGGFAQPIIATAPAPPAAGTPCTAPPP